MKVRRSKLGGLNRGAVGLAFVLVLVLPMVFPNHVRPDPTALARQVAVAEAVEAAPYQIGHWLGTDIPVLRSAVELLRPNAILSRRYRRVEGGYSVSLLVVHCMDIRDMGGHYPPNCYPSAGWSVADDPASGEVSLEFGGRRVPAAVYGFRRIQDGIRESRVRIFNFFVLPDGAVTADIGELRSRSERMALSAQGVAQIQILTAMAMPPVEAVAAANEFLEGMDDLLTSLGVVPGGDRYAP